MTVGRELEETHLDRSTPAKVPDTTEDATRDEALRGLVQRHAGRVPELGRRLDAAGFSRERTPRWAELERVGLLRKSGLAEYQRAAPPLGGLVPEGRRARALFSSPGGIVEPMVDGSVARLVEQLRDVGFRAGDRVLNAFAYHFTPAGLLFHDALVRLGATVLPVGPQQAALAAEFAAQVEATGYVGIASHLKLLLEEADGLPAQCAPRLRVALAGAEPFGDAIRREIEARWRVRCLDLYGTAESGIVAIECDRRDGLHLHPSVLVEVLDPQTGRRLGDGVPGELALTIDSEDFPLLRFATGDLVRIDARDCPCGNPAPRMFPLGRLGGSARVRGMLLHTAQLRDFARRAGNVVAARLSVQRAAGRDRLKLHCRPAAGHAPPPQALADAFRDACRLRVDEVSLDDALPEGEFRLDDERFGASTEAGA